MTRIGRWPPCTTSLPFALSSSRLPASANSLLGASMSIPHAVVAAAGTPNHQYRHSPAQTRKAAVLSSPNPRPLSRQPREAALEPVAARRHLAADATHQETS